MLCWDGDHSVSIAGGGVGGWEMQGGDRDGGVWDWGAVGTGNAGWKCGRKGRCTIDRW